MNRFFYTAFCFLFFFFNVFLSGMTVYAAGPYDLRCEHLVSPIGIDESNPRLTWKITASNDVIFQTAFQIIVGKDSAKVSQGEGDQWDSNRITSSANIARYKGKVLEPFTRYYWLVRVWTGSGNSFETSAVNSFETGLMDVRNWKGSWISDGHGIDTKPAPYFRNTFDVDKKVKKARLYISAAGLYEVSVNGKRVGDHVLDPTYTRFDRRLLYVTHDVTKLMSSGKNAIGVLLGNGWFNHQSVAVWDFHKAPWRARPTFCLDLRIEYEDGSIETVSTNEKWKTSTGPLIFNSIYTAEHYDSRLEQPGWNTVDFDDSQWKPSIIRSAPSRNIVAQTLHPIRHVEKILTEKMTKLNDTTYVFDFGRNISGVTSIRIQGKEGTKIRLKHGERLKADGHVDLSNIDVHYRPVDTTDPFQTDIFILNGKGVQTFSPLFNYKGFQYVEVTSSEPITIRPEDLTAYFMHSDVPATGSITSSNPLINKIWYATNNSYLSNLFGYPTDCPQREKNGWTGDAHIASETGLYNFDGITVYEKWLDDHRDEQQPNGVLPSIIPSNGWGYAWGNGPDWTSTIAIIPWNLYLFYGDTTALTENYDNIKRYVDHIDELYPSGLTTWGLGDWIPVKSKSPVELTSSVYYYVDTKILSDAAKLLGKKTDHEKYAVLAEKIKTAINTKFLDRQKGIYGSGHQTELAVPLFWGIVPVDVRASVAQNLAKAVTATNFHIDTGILGAKAILDALSQNGYPDVAYKLATQQTYPSWGWWIANGATTLLENWDPKAASDVSLNHIMFGEIGAWFFKGLGGIRPDPQSPGFKNVILQPYFAPGLKSFAAEYESHQGKIKSSWSTKGKRVHYEVVIPSNTTANLVLPASLGRKVTLGKKKLVDLPAFQAKEQDQKISFKLDPGTYDFRIN